MAATRPRLPLTLRTPDTDRPADAILRANLSIFREDSSATCAFVMPSTVDGRAGHPPTRSRATRPAISICG
ncbi:hypothetical protein ACWC09_39610 [Streptomyces sp. NPDC001617]